jgi:threonine dehydrogenase-like Zn-dependent dehydrogenase
MKAVAVRPAARTVELIDHPAPAVPTATQVLLRVLEVGVCGTDREICAFEFGTPPPGEDHLVIGHESLAEVVETGPDVRTVAPGDLVVPAVRLPCAEPGCWPCRAGRPDSCRSGAFLERGIRGAHGFMTESVVEDERDLHFVPRALRDVAALVEPLTIAEKALVQLFQIQARLPWACAHAEREGPGHCHRALVLGAGPVGLLGAMALVSRGFETLVFSREEDTDPKADLVRRIGGRFVSASAGPLAAQCGALGPMDVLYEAAGSSRLALDGLATLGPGGVAILTGVPGRHAASPVDTDLLTHRLVLGNQVVLGTVNAGPDAFAAAIRDLALFEERWPAVLRGLITGRHPIEAYRELLLGPPTGIKNLVSFESRASAGPLPTEER